MRRERIPSLDGIRALAIGCVLFGHSFGALRHHVPRGLPLPYGGFGVQVFFVLSGFLITSLLYDGVDLRRFYRRRAYRILPPYVAMLAVATALATLGVVRATRGDLLSAATFTTNYSTASGGWWLGHSWSLSVEEQFYVVWPLALLLLGRDRARRALLWFVALAPALRLLTYVVVPAAHDRVPVMFHTRGDALAVGCLLALAWPRRLPRRGMWLAVAYVPLSWSLTSWLGMGWLAPAGYTLDAVAVAYLVAYAVAHPPRWLNARAVAHVGVLSYSLYLWQQWFLHPHGLPLPLALIATFVAAEASYRLVERPALALRERREQAVAVRRRVVDVRGDADGVAAQAHVDALRREPVGDPAG